MLYLFTTLLILLHLPRWIHDLNVVPVSYPALTSLAPRLAHPGTAPPRMLRARCPKTGRSGRGRGRRRGAPAGACARAGTDAIGRCCGIPAHSGEGNKITRLVVSWEHARGIKHSLACNKAAHASERMCRDRGSGRLLWYSCKHEGPNSTREF